MSWVNEHFNRGSVAGGNKSICKVLVAGVACGAEFKAVTSTDSLATHPKKAHAMERPDGGPVAKKQHTLDTTRLAVQVDDLGPMERFCSIWARCALSYALIEDKEFRAQFHPISLNRHR